MTPDLPLFIGADRVAALLTLPSAAAFLRQRARLEDELLFPPAVRISCKGYRWRTAEVMAWIERQGLGPVPAPARNVMQLRAV